MFHRARNYEKAASIYNRLINIVPDDAEGYTLKTTLYIQWKGDMNEAQKIVDDSKLPKTAFPFFWSIDLKLYQRDFETALEEVEAVSAFSSRRNTSRRRNIHKSLAHLNRFVGNTEASRLHADTACVLLEQQIEKFPTIARLYRDLSVMQALKGDKEQAILTAQKAIDMMPLSLDAYIGHRQELALAQVYTITGEHEKAIEKLDYLLSVPGFLSGHLLHLLRGHFQCPLNLFHFPEGGIYPNSRHRLETKINHLYKP